LKIKNIIITFFTLITFSGWSQSFNQKENAVYIFNFIKYTEFSQKKSNIIIGIIGSTKVESELKNLLSKKSSTITVKHISESEAKSVDVIVIAESSSKSIKEVQNQTAKLPILIITEKPDLNYSGACISLFMDEDDDFKTKFQVSPFNLRSRGLTLASQIINNAVLVR
jgi:hypothetical protein